LDVLGFMAIKKVSLFSHWFCDTIHPYKWIQNFFKRKSYSCFCRKRTTS